ncbi:MAG: putative pterin-4-alpha-carbinolamine dehydratase [Chloroflexota bacterium]|nr:MAG: putative pterin-4-alpha-carbinolamine dehydratase [Chloroflexota bacterium]
MPSTIALSDAQVKAALQELPGWSVVDGKLHKEFKFADFTAAFGFMTKVAIEANTMNHHPEWFNVWNKVVIDLVTHEAGNQISALDVTLARKIEAVL